MQQAKELVISNVFANEKTGDGIIAIAADVVTDKVEFVGVIHSNIAE